MTGIIILAAGSSGRLGTPKQNLVYNGQTLLQHNVKAALATGCRPVIVVLGANEAIIKATILNPSVIAVYNDDWQEGMSSSIRAGITHLKKEGQDISSVILMLCDQPFVDAALLQQLMSTDGLERIAACAYNETIGPPAFFDSFYFPELLSLKGSEGAKKLLLKYESRVAKIPFPLGSVDIDTRSDFEKLTGL